MTAASSRIERRRTSVGRRARRFVLELPTQEFCAEGLLAFIVEQAIDASRTTIGVSIGSHDVPDVDDRAACPAVPTEPDGIARSGAQPFGGACRTVGRRIGCRSDEDVMGCSIELVRQLEEAIGQTSAIEGELV